jgi:hypothetical protein
MEWRWKAYCIFRSQWEDNDQVYNEEYREWQVVEYRPCDGYLYCRQNFRKGGIKDLLLHPKADRLFVYTTTKLCVVSIPTAETKESAIIDAMSTLKWMCHPFSDEHLLGFGPDSVHVFDWQSLEETNLLTFCVSPSDSATNELLSGSTITNSWEARETVGKPILTANLAQILLQVSIRLSAAQKKLHHLLVPVKAITPVSNSQLGF